MKLKCALCKGARFIKEMTTVAATKAVGGVNDLTLNIFDQYIEPLNNRARLKTAMKHIESREAGFHKRDLRKAIHDLNECTRFDSDTISNMERWNKQKMTTPEELLIQKACKKIKGEMSVR